MTEKRDPKILQIITPPANALAVFSDKKGGDTRNPIHADPCVAIALMEETDTKGNISQYLEPMIATGQLIDAASDSSNYLGIAYSKQEALQLVGNDDPYFPEDEIEDKDAECFLA